MLEYPATKKEGIVHFIYKVIFLLSIDADKKTVREVIKQYMSKVSDTRARHMLYLYLQQIQFSFHQTGNPKITRLQLFGENNNRESGKAFHQAFKCSGIRHCEYAHEDMLRVCSAYDRVQLESINDLRKRSSRPHQEMEINEKLKQSTEK